MPAVGLDISDKAVSFVELKRHSGGFVVGRFGRRELPTGAITSGYVNDTGAVTLILRELRDTFRLDLVNASLSEEKAYLYKTKLPNVLPREIRSSIEFTLEENVPIPPSEAIFDYAIISGHGPEHGDGIEVSVTVLPRAVISTYIGLLSDAGLTPLLFEIEAQAMCRAVIANGDHGTYLVVNLEDEKTGLFIVSGGTVHFTATVPIGGAALAVIPRQTGGPFAPTYDSLARNKNVYRTGAPKLSAPDPIAALRAEIKKLSAYWQTHAGSIGETEEAIEKMILCGSAATLSECDKYLSMSLGMNVEVANVWRNAFSFDEYIPPIPFSDSLSYAAAVGLALPKNY